MIFCPVSRMNLSLVFFLRVWEPSTTYVAPRSIVTEDARTDSAVMPGQQRSPQQLDHLFINTIRTLAMDAVEKAQSGHPGMPMGAAAMAYILWTRFLKHNPRNP